MALKPERMFRVLAFQPHGKEEVRGEEGRGTLSIISEIKNGCRSEVARFTRDAGGGADCIDFDLEEYGVERNAVGPQQRVKVTLSTVDGKQHSFVAFKEIPVDDAQAVRVTIVRASINPQIGAKNG